MKLENYKRADKLIRKIGNVSEILAKFDKIEGRKLLGINLTYEIDSDYDDYETISIDYQEVDELVNIPYLIRQTMMEKLEILQKEFEEL